MLMPKKTRRTHEDTTTHVMQDLLVRCLASEQVQHCESKSERICCICLPSSTAFQQVLNGGVFQCCELEDDTRKRELPNLIHKITNVKPVPGRNLTLFQESRDQ